MVAMVMAGHVRGRYRRCRRTWLDRERASVR